VALEFVGSKDEQEDGGQCDCEHGCVSGLGRLKVDGWCGSGFQGFFELDNPEGEKAGGCEEDQYHGVFLVKLCLYLMLGPCQLLKTRINLFLISDLKIRILFNSTLFDGIPR
jgi:hypothetical protein